jgi:Domain of Unknown Function (DUF1543)
MLLFFLLLGGRPAGRHTEQHDVFFSLGNSVGDLISDIKEFWPESKSNIHIDAWRSVTRIDNFRITVIERNEDQTKSNLKLFFLNLGGYQRGQFDELHYKYLCVAENKAEAITKAKETKFYAEAGFPGAPSHIDDKFGVDIDDIYEIEDILPLRLKEKFKLQIQKDDDVTDEDHLHLGYFKLSSFIS